MKYLSAFKAVAFLMLFAISTVFAFSEGEISMVRISTDDLSIEICPGNGSLQQLHLFGQECTLLEEASFGFSVTDAVANRRHEVGFPMIESQGQWVQKGVVPELDLQMKATYKQCEGYMRVHGVVEDLSNSDRVLVVAFTIPVDASNWQWADDINVSRKIVQHRVYENVANLASHPMNIYPFSAIYCDAYGLAMGVPLNQPRLFRIRYDNTGYTISFTLALSPDTSNFPRQAEFEFVIYAFPAQWGMRAAAQRYYDAFPEHFNRRVEEAGNWVFCQDYRQVPALGDFRLKFNETPMDYQMDLVQNIVSFRYTAPSEKWLGWPDREREPEPSKEEFLALLERSLSAPDDVIDYDHKILPLNYVARAITNSGIYDSNGELMPIGWYAYGPMVDFVVNSDPHLPSPNFFETQVQHVRHAEKEATQSGGTLKGIYIDNLDWAGGLINYRKEHFTTARDPLIWDSRKRTGQLLAFTQHQYVTEMANLAKEEDKILLGNVIYPERGLFYVHALDVPGGEVGTGFGTSDRDFAIRRTLAYQKPWTLLLTENLAYGRTSSWDYAQREKLLQLSMFYGIFTNVLGLHPTQSDWAAYRPLFKKYMPVICALDRAGWFPVTWASAATSEVQLERYGDFRSNAGYFTLRNTKEDPCTTQIAIDLKGIGLLQEESVFVFDLLKGVYVDALVDETARRLDIEFAFAGNQVTAWLVGTKLGIWNESRRELLIQAHRAKSAATTLRHVTELTTGLERLVKLLEDDVETSVDISCHLQGIAQMAQELKKPVLLELDRLRNQFFREHLSGELLQPLETITEFIERISM
ncbi:MAG: hypothetical protein M0Q40_01285 [Limnochordia bacterium]|nr:hypothetical protein [Limnochordia bacterium]